MESKRIMMVGASGSGKTTLAKLVATQCEIPFVSGSITSLQPELADKHQSELIEGDPKELFRRENMYLSQRFKLVSNLPGSFITDRSFVDNAAYTIYKLSKSLPNCDIETVLNGMNQCLLSANITHLIFLPITEEMIHNQWTPEANGKRITNRYFQYLISGIMSNLLRLFPGPNEHWRSWKPVANDSESVMVDLGNLKILYLEDYNLEKRLYIVHQFLKK